MVGLISRVANLAAAVVLVAVIVVILVSVIARTIFGVGLVDAVTPSRMGMTLLIFLGLAWAQRRGDHVSIGLVITRIPPRPRAIIHMIGMSLGLVATIVLAYLTWKYAEVSLRLDERIRGDILWLAFPFKVAIPIGLTAFALEIVRTIIREALGLWIDNGDDRSDRLIGLQ